jgi:DUF2971 family protein
MCVYKFLSVKFALKDLAERRIKLSEFGDMNDPFELMGSQWADPFVDRLLTSYAQNLGVLCFSKNWCNPLLWSHYADKHKGICLGFDIPEGAGETPIYVDRRERLNPEILFEAIRTGRSQMAEQQIPRKLLLKFEDWRYEDEVRLFARLDGKPVDFSYFDFGTNMVLCEVIAGPRCTVTKKKIEGKLNGYSGSVSIIKAKLSDSFQVIEDPDGFTT